MIKLITNSRISHDFTIIESFEAGLKLTSSETKSLSQNGATLQGSFVKVASDLIPTLYGASIARYSNDKDTLKPYQADRPRLLLLHRREILKIIELTRSGNRTILPKSIYLKNGKYKVEIVVATGKKAHDKRRAQKDKTDQKMVRDLRV